MWTCIRLYFGQTQGIKHAHICTHLLHFLLGGRGLRIESDPLAGDVDIAIGAKVRSFYASLLQPLFAFLRYSQVPPEENKEKKGGKWVGHIQQQGVALSCNLEFYWDKQVLGLTVHVYNSGHVETHHIDLG